jgi:hypothetical protein
MKRNATIGLFAAFLLAITLRANAAEDKRPLDSESPTRSNYVPSHGGQHTPEERDKLIGLIEARLAQLKPLPPAKKSADTDYFVIGMTELGDGKTVVNFVHFLTIAGQREAATAIADFLLDATGRAKRFWQPMGRVKNEAAAQNLLARARLVEKKLEQFPLNTKGKKSSDDAFAVGTAELNLKTLHADVRFQVIQGTTKVSDFLIAFMLAAPENSQRQWHVFFRAKTTDEADKYVEQLRIWYDSLDSQRREIAKIYRARTTRRC